MLQSGKRPRRPPLNPLAHSRDQSRDFFQKAFSMSDNAIAGFFICLGVYLAVSLVGDLQTGIIADSRWGDVDVRDLPGLFYVRIFIKVFMIGLAIAVLLHAFGLIGDPFVWMREYLPFLMPRHRS
jgi:hypothetical protein